MEKKDSRQAKFCLLCWLDSEEVGMMPCKAIRLGQECYTAALGEFKWQTTYFEAEP